MKISLTPAGIEPATFLFVAQHFNHCASAVPLVTGNALKCSRWDLRPRIRPESSQLAGERAECRGL